MTMFNVRFVHMRLPDDQGGLSSFGGTTAAYVVDTVDTDGKPTTISYSVAQCSYKDHYVKSVGRMYAAGRLINEIGIVSLELDGMTPEQAIRVNEGYADHVFEEEVIPEIPALCKMGDC